MRVVNKQMRKVIEPEGGRGAGAGGAASTSSSFGHGTPGEMKTGSESDSTVCSTERARICRATSICRGTTTRFHACSSYFQSGHSWRLLASLNMAFKRRASSGAPLRGCRRPRQAVIGGAVVRFLQKKPSLQGNTGDGFAALKGDALRQACAESKVHRLFCNKSRGHRRRRGCSGNRAWGTPRGTFAPNGTEGSPKCESTRCRRTRCLQERPSPHRRPAQTTERLERR